jgi:hypothetical protein
VGLTTVLAVYGALVATAALAIELVSQWRSWSTRVEVTVSRMSLLEPGKPEEPVILFRLTNHSAHRVKVTHLSMEPVRKGGKHLFFPQPLPLGVPGPFEIPPRDSITLYQPPESLSDSNPDPDHKTRATVATSDNKQFSRSVSWFATSLRTSRRKRPEELVPNLSRNLHFGKRRSELRGPDPCLGHCTGRSSV